jgi:hypothetical protein
LVHKVWKVIVNYDKVWLFPCHRVVHLMYWSS